MKKWLIIACVAAICASVQAAEEGKKKAEAAKEKKPMTKEQYLAAKQKRAEKNGTEFNKALAEKQFERMDKNKDGILSPEERQGKKAAPKKDAPKKAPKKTADEE